jgi:hypothetical protein
MESVNPPIHSPSILTSRMRLKLRSKLMTKTALGAIYAYPHFLVASALLLSPDGTGAG